MPLVLQPDALAFANTSNVEASPKLYKFRLEPPAQACLRLHSAFVLQGIDILCGLNSLRKLFDLACGKQSKGFRIDMELCSTALMTTRWESLQETMSQTFLCRRYGRGFGASCTTQEGRLTESSSHRRAISYSLSDLNLIVQFEVDAFHCLCSQRVDGKNLCSNTRVTDGEPVLAVAEVSQSNFPEDFAPYLDIVDIGMTHDNGCMIEIKSRDHKNKASDDIMVQMWLSGSRQLYLGRHIRGHFNTDAVYRGNMKSDISIWQRQHGDEIVCLTALLRQIRQKVSQSASGAVGGRLALICERLGTDMILKLWRREAGQDIMRLEILVRLQRHCQVA